MKAFFKRQRRSVLSRIGAGSENWFDSERWNRELAEDMLPALTAIADQHGAEAAEALEWSYDTDLTRAYRSGCRGQSKQDKRPDTEKARACDGRR